MLDGKSNPLDWGPESHVRDPRFSELDALIAGDSKDAECLECGKDLRGYQQLRFCTPTCSNQFYGRKRRKLTKALLNLLYVENRLALTKVARLAGCNPASVHAALKRFGIPRRKYTDAVICVEADCGKPAIKFPYRRGLTGNRCERHLRLKRAEWSRNSRRRNAHPLSRERRVENSKKAWIMRGKLTPKGGAS